jgi:hypothetical protein
MELVCHRTWTEVPVKFFCKGNLQKAQIEEMKQLPTLLRPTQIKGRNLIFGDAKDSVNAEETFKRICGGILH